MNAIKSLIASAAALGVAGSAAAHNIDIEPQATANEGHANASDIDWKSDKDGDKGKPTENFSWAYPYDMTKDVPVLQVIEDGEVEYDVDEDNGTPTWLGGILTSRATFGYLDGFDDQGEHPWQPDVDVFNFTVKAGQDIGQVQAVPSAANWAAQGMTVAVASPIPPACEENRNDYPAIALTVPCSLMLDANGAPLQTPIGPAQTMFMGPAGDLPFETTTLASFPTDPPFPGGPPGTAVILSAPSLNGVPMCVAQVAFNIPTANRVVFNEPHTNNAWFLPTGCYLTVNQNGNTVPVCNGDLDGDGIPDGPPAPGVFYPLPAILPFDYTNQLIVWNPTGERMDYTLNSGFAEGFPWVAHNHELEEEIENNGWTTHPCTPAQ